MRLDVVREGRDPAVENSAGTIIRATCAKEYALNLQNPNGTVKCVRGRWKPMLPDCSLRKRTLSFNVLKTHLHVISYLVPCSVPSTEHGSYLAIAGPDHPEVTRHSANTKLLTAFEEIHNGDIIDFQCDEGYNIQGSNQLKCWHGNWDVNNLPECLAAPCVLPTISNAVYQVRLI